MGRLRELEKVIGASVGTIYEKVLFDRAGNHELSDCFFIQSEQLGEN